MWHDKSKWVLLFWGVEEDDDGEGGIVREVVVGIFGLHEELRREAKESMLEHSHQLLDNCV